MKLAAIASFLVAASVVFAAPSTVSKRDPSVDVVTTYNGIDGTVLYSFEDCIPFRIDGKLVSSGQVNSNARCYFYTDSHCTLSGSAEILVPKGVNIPNLGDFAELFGESAICYKTL